MTSSGTVATVLIGFLGTANAIVLGMVASEVIGVLKKSGYWDGLLAYFQVAVWGSAILLVISVFGFFVEPKQNPDIKPWLITALSIGWMLSAVFAITSFVHVTRTLATPYKIDAGI